MLQAFKVVFLVSSMLVYDEEIAAKPCQDEAEVELPYHLHAGKVLLLEDPLELSVSCLARGLGRVLGKEPGREFSDHWSTPTSVKVHLALHAGSQKDGLMHAKMVNKAQCTCKVAVENCAVFLA